MKFPTVLLVLLATLAGLFSCHRMSENTFAVDESLDYSVRQTDKTLALLPEDDLLPRNIAPGDEQWKLVGYEDWTSGFWPGVLWQLYEYTGEEKWAKQADHYSRLLTPLSVRSATDHDLGFQVFNSFGRGYRLKKHPDYKDVLLKAADTLATLYNPTVGTILSWPGMVEKMDWPHNTIIDNMINLELLFWASENGGAERLRDIAIRHAETTMNNHFRDDFTSYHVVVYDTLTGEKIKGVTHQGYSDDSMWARGQGWAIYGFTMVYRETKDPKFLDFAQKVADVYLDRLPEDRIPYWDFAAPGAPDEPRDASAAAVAASSLLELSTYVNRDKSDHYRGEAQAMLAELSSERYRSGNSNPALLLHSTGHYPNHSEIDFSIIYADYYYLEALMRLRNLQEHKSVFRSIAP